MSKAILVLDGMPTSCEICKLNSGEDDDPYCDILEDWSDAYSRDIDCPLRDLPEHIPTEKVKPDEYMRGYDEGFINGYNSALSDIGGDGDAD